MPERNEPEVVIIGGGPGGYYAALRLAQRGKSVAVIEREDVGGVCLNWGCIPSKALISAAERYHQATTSQKMGLHVEGARFEFAEAQAWTRGIVHHHVAGVEALLKDAKIELVRGDARVAPGLIVEVRGADGRLRELRPASVVVATGARTTAPPGVVVDQKRVLSAKEAIRLENLPPSLLVLGGGVIGLELGGMFARAGSDVTVLEGAEQLLGTTDADLVRVVERALVREGVTIEKGVRVSRVEAQATKVIVELGEGADKRSLEASHLLVATGFAPNTDGLFAVDLGVELDARGHVRIDRSCRTNVAGIYAIGDVTGGPYLAHKAFKEAEVVAEVISGHDVVVDYVALPSAIFTSPEIAVTGLTENAARARGESVEVARFPLAALGRTQTVGGSDGFVKLVHRGGRILGMSAVGPHVTELLGEATLGLETGASLEDLALTIHPHPTFSEALREAAEVALGQAIHVKNRKSA